MSIDFDSHILVITADEVISPSGTARPWQVRSEEHLSKVLLRWKPRSVPVGKDKTQAPQCYLVGAQLLTELGLVAEGQTFDEITTDLRGRLTDFARGMPDWKQRFRPSASWAYLAHQNGQPVDLILTPYLHLMAGKYDMGITGDGETDAYDLPEDDGAAGRELLRRVSTTLELLKVLPKSSASGTGAEHVARLNRGRTALIGPSYQPDLEGTASGQDLPERAMNWFADRVEPRQAAQAAKLVVIDQRAAYLNSAQIDLGWGEPRHVGRGEAEALIAQKKLPQAWWLVTIDRFVPELTDLRSFPAPSPVRTHLDEDGVRTGRETTAWITTTALHWLLKPEDRGGMGIRPDVKQAWVFPHTGRPLVGWVEEMKIALSAAEYDEEFASEPWQKALGDYWFKRVYKAYIGRMVAASTWSTDATKQHIQPFWEQSIVANTRGLALLYAAKIRRETGLTPLASETDAWTYIVPEGISLDADSTNGWLGKYRTKVEIELTDDDRAALAKANSAPAVAAAIKTIMARSE